MSFFGRRPLGPEARGGGGGSAGRGHERKESGLLRAAGRARLPQPLQAAGRLPGGTHGGDQGNAARPALGQRGRPRPSCGPPARGLILGPRFPSPLPEGAQRQLPLRDASRSAVPSLGPRAEAGEGPCGGPGGSSAPIPRPCGGAAVKALTGSRSCRCDGFVLLRWRLETTPSRPPLLFLIVAAAVKAETFAELPVLPWRPRGVWEQQGKQLVWPKCHRPRPGRGKRFKSTVKRVRRTSVTITLTRATRHRLWRGGQEGRAEAVGFEPTSSKAFFPEGPAVVSISEALFPAFCTKVSQDALRKARHCSVAQAKLLFPFDD